MGIDSGRRYLAERNDETGQVLLTPLVSVPVTDLTPELRERLEDGFAAARRGDLRYRGSFASHLDDEEGLDDHAEQPVPDPLRAQG